MILTEASAVITAIGSTPGGKAVGQHLHQVERVDSKFEFVPMQPDQVRSFKVTDVKETRKMVILRGTAGTVALWHTGSGSEKRYNLIYAGAGDAEASSTTYSRFDDTIKHIKAVLGGKITSINVGESPRKTGINQDRAARAEARQKAERLTSKLAQQTDRIGKLLPRYVQQAIADSKAVAMDMLKANNWSGLETKLAQIKNLENLKFYLQYPSDDRRGNDLGSAHKNMIDRAIQLAIAHLSPEAVTYHRSQYGYDRGRQSAQINPEALDIFQKKLANSDPAAMSLLLSAVKQQIRKIK